MRKQTTMMKVLNVFLAFALALSGFTALLAVQPVYAMNTPALQYFYVTLPEDVMMQYLRDIFTAGTLPIPPVRSIISIAIGTTGTLVYYDQWEDGGYDADIANPDGNYYNATTNPDGTQIWGDGVIANGCPPSINNIPNPCTLPAHDRLMRGNMITLDNMVTVAGAPGAYTRNPAQIFYDGRDKVAASLPVAMARAIWPSGAGSLVADAQGILPTERWGANYLSPVGENNNGGSASYEDVRLLVMAGVGGATINVDANADGDFVDASDRNNYVMTEGQVLSVNDGAGIVNNVNTSVRAGARVQVVSGNPVQVTLLTGDVGSTYENRFYNLIPRGDWVNDYYTPVGTPAGGTSCTSNWIYNPTGATIRVYHDFLGGASPDGFTDVPANSAMESPDVPAGSGARFYTTGATPPVFLPISGTDCARGGNGDIYDWGHELYPVDQLSPEILIGWAPGCTNESPIGACLEVDGAPANTKSRSVVWVTPLANTTLYVDLDGSGIACPSGAGAERTIPASALQAVQIADDPNNVRDQFDTVAYNNNGGGNYNANWASSWTEVGDNGVAATGQIWITAGYLEFRETDTSSKTNDNVWRVVQNLTGQGFVRLSFRSTLNIGANDNVVVEASPDGGSNWYTVATYTASHGATTQVYDIRSYASANTAIRFRIAQEWENGSEYWRIDNVNVDYSVGDGRRGDFDMTGAYIRTCDDTLIAAAFGQNPTLSGSGDNEAMDLGMGIPPYGSQIRITKEADRSFTAPGDLVTYNYTVRLIQTFSTAVNNVEVVDDKCAPVTYVSGDTANSGYLDPGEVWNFTCTGRMYTDTTNYALALALYGTDRIRSNPAYDTVLLTSSLGDYIWLDEDGDGDQDAGESGIPNARVTLVGVDMDGNPVSLETYTDSNGRYIFTNVPPSNTSGYTITVATATLPAGLAANPTYDENGIGTPHRTVVVLGSGLEYTTADFGYNWAAPAHTNGNTGIGAIGDRIWIDADGDGFQDANEAGLSGVMVTLYYDPDGDGVFDTSYNFGGYNPVRTTDAAGNYIFDDLPVGTYVIGVSLPSGYTQTGDPDQPGAACTACDGRTTTPILLAPGDVYLNADFGYQPTGGGNTIGNLIFLDANGDGNWDAGEPGLPGVSVALLDGSGNVIATTVTDVNGAYSFPGLPDGVYTVWVNDATHVLGELRQNSTPDNANDGGQLCGVCNGRNTVTVSGGAGNTFQDFGYAPAGHSSGDGLIGDTIWLDSDGDGQYDPGEGLEGVVVNLLNASGQIIARTVTNENGQYFFGDLPAGTYTVDINTNSLPNYGTGLANFVDPDGGRPNRAVLTLPAGGINLNQDFGYRVPTNPNTISGTIWHDTNADGALSGEAGRFAGVTVALYDSNGNIVATTTTDSSGNYSFPGLPDGAYRVDVTDEANVLNGYWKSNGPTPGADNNSQSDPYTVTVSGGQTNTTADFGYYLDPARIGDKVWLDRDNDGIQDADEPGIRGVRVTLTIAYPGGGAATLITFTGPNGAYSFNNLLLDEDYRLADNTPGTPTYTISFATPPSTTPSPTGAGAPDTDSNGVSTVANPLYQGQTDITYDSGFWTERLDLGDLPDVYYTRFSPGPAHIIFPQGSIANVPTTTTGIPAVWLGTIVDVELDGQPGAQATGDDASNNDEDGLRFPASVTPGSTANFVVTVNSSEATTVYFGLWIDWGDGAGGLPDGSFDAFYAGFGVTASPTDVTVLVDVPSNYNPGNPIFIRLRAADFPLLEADSTGTIINGEVEDYRKDWPTAITLAAFDAVAQNDAIRLTWETAMELDNVGFNLYRSETVDGPYTRLNTTLIPPQNPGSIMGAVYEWLDTDVQPGVTYYYKLEDLDVKGVSTMHGPVTATARPTLSNRNFTVFLPLVIRQE